MFMLRILCSLFLLYSSMAYRTTPLQNDLDAFGLRIVRAEKELERLNLELSESRHGRFLASQQYALPGGADTIVVTEAKTQMQKWYDTTVEYRNSLMEHIDKMRVIYQWKCSENGRAYFRLYYGAWSEEEIS